MAFAQPSRPPAPPGESHRDALMSPSSKQQPRAADGRQPSVRLPSPRSGSQRQDASESQRFRLLSAMTFIVSETGPESVTVARVVDRAGVSRKTFYDLFDGSSDCLLAAIEEAVELAATRAGAAYAPPRRWVDRVRAALFAVLEFFDQEPELARLCVVHAMAAPAAALTRRREVLDQLARTIDEGGSATRVSRHTPPLVAEGVLGGVLGVLHSRLLQPEPQPLTALLNPLMSMIALPYLGSAAALRELGKPIPESPPAPSRRARRADPLDGLNIRMTYRTLKVLSVIAEEPGLSNIEISELAGISDQGQISKMLARLARLGLMKNTGDGQALGGPNAWHLTPRGKALERASNRDALNLRR
jgi:AcrR family transcriptional regulator/DNA-binding MarR family transcriptional regulator